jgi:hypothetical protein
MTEANNIIINEPVQTKELIQFQTSDIIETDNCIHIIFDSQTKQEGMEIRLKNNNNNECIFTETNGRDGWNTKQIFSIFSNQMNPEEVGNLIMDETQETNEGFIQMIKVITEGVNRILEDISNRMNQKIEKIQKSCRNIRRWIRSDMQ